MIRRENLRRRRRAFREESSQILIVCGGRSTEPDYFNGLRRFLRNPAVKVKIRSQGVDPKNLVEHAAVIDHRGQFDEVWCVVDVDEFDLPVAVRAAHGQQVRLAISNPCFEYWLLLHFESCDACLGGCDDVARRLKKHLRSYDKTALRFKDFENGVNDAVNRAKQRRPAAGKHEHELNPSTRVWELVEAIQPAS